MSGVVHPILEGSVQMRERFGRRSEAHVFAKVVTTFLAIRAFTTHDAGFDGDALADDKVLYAWSDGGDDSGGLMPEYQGCLEGKVTVTSVDVIMNW